MTERALQVVAPGALELVERETPEATEERFDRIAGLEHRVERARAAPRAGEAPGHG